MTNATDTLIEEFTKEAVYIGEFENKKAQNLATGLLLAAATLRSFRDTLISIAQNQGPIPSHQAQDVLTKAGYCGHFNQIFRVENKTYLDAIGEGKYYFCPDCDLRNKNKMVPFA